MCVIDCLGMTYYENIQSLLSIYEDIILFLHRFYQSGHVDVFLDISDARKNHGTCMITIFGLAKNLEKFTIKILLLLNIGLRLEGLQLTETFGTMLSRATLGFICFFSDNISFLLAWRFLVP
ncbi:hypothetical protein ACJX0J_026807 [Zea mays]